MDEITLKRLLDEALYPVKKDLKLVKSDLESVKDTLENRVLPSITETELTLKFYSDSYKINQHNIERLDTRTATIEDKFNIDVPEELQIQHFSSK